MINLDKFIESCVRIDYMEDSDEYGHFPFQLFAIMKDDKVEMNALALGGDVVACYDRVNQYVAKEAKCIYLSVDFPAGGDILNDFVAVFEVKPGEHVKLVFIPYCTVTGNRLPKIEKSTQLQLIFDQFAQHLFTKD